MAKAEYEYLLARVSDQQREHPQHYPMHAAANAAYADYYQRMIDTAGRPDISDHEGAWLLQQGWTAERLERLTVLIGLHADRPAISQRSIQTHLREIGFEPTRQLRRRVISA